MRAIACVLARGDHAARCARCRTAAAQDAKVRALADAAPPAALSVRARDAAFARAFAAPATAPARRSTWLVPAGVALAAAAAVIAIVATRGDGATDATPASRPIVAGSTTAVGHGKVALSADGVGWQTGPTEVYLLTGVVEVEVDPAPHQPFRVRTNDFVVDVLGTVFTVSADGVSVSRGAVRVSRATGEVVVERLAAGERWDAHAKTAAAPEPDEEPEEIEMDPASAGAPPRDLAKEVIAAKAQLVKGSIDDARRAATAVLAAKPRRAVRADAEQLLADCDKNDGNDDRAVERYRALADRYRDRGEYALGAAIRIEHRRRRAEAERDLYRIYLERYPDGVLAGAARKALGTK